jgi:uncharacterized membrane protein (GlpM family)
MRALAIVTTVVVATGILAFAYGFAFHRFELALDIGKFVIVIVSALATLVAAYEKTEETAWSKRRIEQAEKRVAENPREPQAAWELAQVKLESYLNRNLSQVKSVYILTVIVMIVGFSLIIGGSVEAFREPDRFRASVLSSLSGIIVSFIGGTFLVLHRSIMSQAKDYVTILERINAVGMSMQILNSIESENNNLKEETTAAIAQQLLSMYSDHVPKFTRTRRPNGNAATS